MIKKIIKAIGAGGFLLSFSINASLVCPANLTCNYDEGSCNQSDEWHVMNASVETPFLGTKLFTLSDIISSRIDFPENPYGKYRIVCYYRYPSSIMPIMIFTFVNKLVGDNWVYSGFNKWMARCSNITDPFACAGEK